MGKFNFVVAALLAFRNNVLLRRTKVRKMADDINACEIVLELCFEVAKEASRGRLKPIYSIGFG